MIQIPDGSPDAVRCYGAMGHPAAVVALIADRGAVVAAERMGVCIDTLRTWRRALGLHVKPRIGRVVCADRVCEGCGAGYAKQPKYPPVKWAMRRFCGRACANAAKRK